MAAAWVLSTLLVTSTPAYAHEISPAIADLSQQGNSLHLDISVNMEAILAGIDQSAYGDTNNAPQAPSYDRLRALPDAQLGERARTAWADIAPLLHLGAGGAGTPLALNLDAVTVTPEPLSELPRETVLTLTAALPVGTQAVTFGWDASLGMLVVRQQGVEDPYTAVLEQGATSAPIALSGGNARTGWQAFVDYIPVGYRHILPLGLDHILFVLGLYLLSTHWRPLLWQVSAFTVAHTISLALAASGVVSVSASIVEPLIAASITFVALENVFTSHLHRWRPLVVFAFGLLHGLGFASVLTEWGLPEGAFFPALIGFNVGVELGQLTVIATAFIAVGYWFGAKSWYRAVISIPASVAIAIIGSWWVVERTLL